MSDADKTPDHETTGLEVLRAIEQRVLWLAVAMVDHANRQRPDPSGLKVGGHQASSASMVTILTALYFDVLRAEDRVSVKPHASPALHAVNFLLGRLDGSQLRELRAFGGLQSYPSRAKDPDPVDYSTGSVGLGATATIWGALARRIARPDEAERGRQYALIGDAELDEGAVWEAVLDPVTRELGEIVWIVDLNRQSLDRIVPHIAAGTFEGMFAAAGWEVITLKYGERLREIFGRPGGNHLRRRLDEMTNAEYQRLLRLDAPTLRRRLPGDGPGAADITAVIDSLDDEQLLLCLRDLGGHDLAGLIDALHSVDDGRPTVILAYTIKGYSLPSAGHPQNHSRLLDVQEMAALALQLDVNPMDPFQGFSEDSAQALLCAAAARRLQRSTVATDPLPRVPEDFGRSPQGHASTQQALGRALLDLSRTAPDLAARVVTVAPDVATSTNLAGWLQKAGVWSTAEGLDWFADDAQTLLHWTSGPAGRHVELGIAEVNLVGLLGELGATWSRWGCALFPIGVVYDPFVARALEPWSFGIYSGGQSILVGTPSGVTLAAEGGAHQSVMTPSIGIEQPDCVYFEPAFAQELEWCLLDGLGRLGKVGGSSTYLRLSTRPVDQKVASIPIDPAARDRRRRQVLAGGYRLRTVHGARVAIVVMGALVTEALEASDRLAAQGVDADIVVVTSPDRLMRAARVLQGLEQGDGWILEHLFPSVPRQGLVTVLDGHPHTLAFLAAVARNGMTVNLGVTRFGQSGSLADVYRWHRIDADAIIAAALDLDASCRTDG